MKKTILTLIILTTTAFGSSGSSYIDPFRNPIYELQKRLEAKKEVQETVIKPNLFKPKIPVPFERLSIQGVIKKGNKFILVLLDPETGETYFLKEGDAVSKNEKIAKITTSQVILTEYLKKGKRLIVRKIALEIEKGGS
ncbi:pilus assembly protein PilP [Thermovibrio sp.]